MTPQQSAADLDAIVAAIDATFERDGDRRYRLEDTRVRLAVLARQLRATPATPGTDPATGPGQLADRLTALLDGPHADEHTARAAGLASEAARFLNYATGPHARQGLTYPATVYRVAGALAEAAGRLPQLFGQLTAWLDAEQAAGRLAEDHGGPVAPLTDRARHHLDQAARHATALGAALSWAQCDLATLHTAEGSQR